MLPVERGAVRAGERGGRSQGAAGAAAEVDGDENASGMGLTVALGECESAPRQVD